MSKAGVHTEVERSNSYRFQLDNSTLQNDALEESGRHWKIPSSGGAVIKMLGELVKR
jgi:hypothetical protein